MKYDAIRRTANPLAIAAVMSVLAFAAPVRAEIVYQSVNAGINNSTYNLDLNGDGITDFTFTSVSEPCALPCLHHDTLNETPAPGNGAIVGPLTLGSNIGPTQVYDESEAGLSGRVVSRVCVRGHCWILAFGYGPWLRKTGYLGLSFQINGQTYYGWAQLSVGAGAGTLLDYAYETIPGRAIKAGQTSYAWFTPTSLNFHTVIAGTSVSRSVILTNLGLTTLTITNATLTGSADFTSENSGPPCGGSVAVGAHCKLTFTFKPSIAGTETATYSVAVEGSATPQNLPLTGTGTYVEFTPASLNFGTVPRGTTVSGSVTLTNLGPTALTMSKAVLGGTNKADFASENGNPPCGGSVAAAATCTLTFTFTPSISGNEGAVYYVHDNGGASPQALKLTGTGQ